MQSQGHAKSSKIARFISSHHHHFYNYQTNRLKETIKRRENRESIDWQHAVESTAYKIFSFSFLNLIAKRLNYQLLSTRDLILLIESTTLFSSS